MQKNQFQKSLTTVLLAVVYLSFAVDAAIAQRLPQSADEFDSVSAFWDFDRDGIPNRNDACPSVNYKPGFDVNLCSPMDLNPDNDSQAECKARERVAKFLMQRSVFMTNIAFAVVIDGEVHFADAFEYIGQGQFNHDPDGVNRLYRVGSTSKSVTSVAAKILEESGVLTFDDFVNDDDASQKFVNGERTLKDLLTHQGAFKLDSGSVHMFCYDGDLAAFWAEPDDLVSPHFDSDRFGNLGGGYEYSAFNYSLAGAYMSNKAGVRFENILQSAVFDVSEMCTATVDSTRAAGTAIGNDWALSEGAVMHVGPYINLVAPTDDRCEDNFYNSDDLPGDDYDWQYFFLDEADAEVRDPPGGVIASVIDMANFAQSLLNSYHAPGGLVSQEGIRQLWSATQDLGCFPNCPYQRYYATGFFTDNLMGNPVQEVEHGGSRAGYASAFVLRPEANVAISILTNADASTVALSDLAKEILDDFQN